MRARDVAESGGRSSGCAAVGQTCGGVRGGPGRRKLPAVGLAVVAAILAFGAQGASASTTTLGLGGWRVESSAQVTQGGAQISQPGFTTGSWLAVTPDDAGAPGTEINALVQNGACSNVFFSTNMKQCFGYMDQLGAETIPQFSVPWWFRTDFNPNLRPSQHAELIVNGIVGQADVWVNGTEVATQATVQGDYTRYAFDITGLIRSGTNSLALEVYPNNPNTMFTLDNVDWTQIPPDNNSGIQFPVQLHVSDALALSDTHVAESNAANLSSSALTLKGEVTNNTATSQTGTVTATVTPPPGGGSPITVSGSVTVTPRATRTVSFTSSDDPRLTISHPMVWWPYQMGAQPLYGLSMSVAQPGAATDSQSETFGIRTVTSRLIGPSPEAPDGARQFLVNGQPFVFRAGGWSEDLFLRYSSANTADQIALMKNLGLNGIRTEGKQMPDDFYEQMDKAGLLIDGGFQCCDAWQLQDSGLTTTQDFRVLYLSALTIGENLRNHPSVMNFSWSDDQPTPKQENVSLQGFSDADFQDPLISSAEYNSSPKLGPSGEKEGPYDWVPPSYWYDITHYDPTDPTRTNVGGSWAFDSEASAGHTVPTLDSIQRFLSPLEQAELWQNPDYNQYHANYEPDLPNPATNGGYSFGTLHDLDQAISARYGAWSSLAQYVEEAQVQNYETQRAEFEAYIDHSTNRPTPSTGVVYWQLNKGWPTLLWDLYNQDYDQAGSYFGAKKANEALHVLFAYDNDTVAVDNLTNSAQTGLSVESKVYDLAGKLLDDRTANPITVAGQGVANAVLRPKVPATTTPPAPATTYFVEVIMRQHGAVVDRNVYWLSTQQDVVNWPATVGFPQATMTQFGDLTQLQGLPAAKLAVSAITSSQPGPDGADTVTKVRITNTSPKPTVAFFLRADVRRGTGAKPAAGDNEVLPIFWSDNDITLWPGESVTLSGDYHAAALQGQSPVVSVSGWNTATMNVQAS
jgi:exo-1,4-beta-D-glucosaminidase